MISIKQFSCPSCGAVVNLAQKASKVASCGSCNSIIDVKSPEYRIIEERNSQKQAPRSHIKLGMIANFDGSEFQVIGRICKKSQIKEWDFEDSRYYTEPWSSDTWILVSSKRKVIYLGEDEEGYYLSKSFTPTKPGIPERGESFMTFHESGTPRRILERGGSTITYFEGEFTWTPQIGGVSQFAECGMNHDRDSNRCSVEWRLDAQTGEIEEIEYFNTRSLSLLELAEAFNLQDVLSKEIHKQNRDGELRKWAYAFFLVAGIMLLLAMTAMVGDGKLLAKHEVGIRAIDNSSVLFGPITLKDKGSVHKLELRGSIPDNSWAWTALELLDQDKNPINNLDAEFYHETGYDSDGRWVESFKKKSKLFRLKKPGTYFFRLLAEKGTSSSGQVSISVYSGLSISRYYWLGMFFSLGYAVSLLHFKKASPLYVLFGLFALSFFVLSKFGEDD
jgi:ribosomal protein S27AE